MKKIIIKLLLFFSLFTLLIFIGFYLKNDNEITLKKALEISNNEAIKWADDAQLVFITSTDARDNPSESSGNNGKRNSWNIVFSSHKKNKQYNIIISSKKIIYNKEIDMPVYNYIDSNKISLDSTDLIKIAKNNGLSANSTDNNWAIGYHFALQYLNDNNENTFLAYSVYGTFNGNFSYIIIDFSTGKLISIMEQTGYDKDGKSVWKEINNY